MLRRRQATTQSEFRVGTTDGDEPALPHSVTLMTFTDVHVRRQLSAPRRGVVWINPVEGWWCPFWTLPLLPTADCEGAPRALRAEAARSLSPSCSSGGRYTRLSLSRSNVAAYAAQRRAAFRDCATIR